MSDNSANKELTKRINALENRLIEVLKRLSDYESNNSGEIKKLEDNLRSNESEMININTNKISILWERMNKEFKSFEKSQERLFSITKYLQEMIDASKDMNSANNDLRNIELEELNRLQEVKGQEIYKYVDKKFEEKELNLNELIAKSINSKVEWNNLVHNADFRKLDDILAYYITTDNIPEESNINYHQLKKRLSTLLEEASKQEGRPGQTLNGGTSKEEIEKKLIDLNRAYFRKNKRKSRKSFISIEAKNNFLNEKEVAKDRQSKLPMKNFSIRLNEDYLNRLKLISDKTGNNRNDLIRDAIDKALERWEDLDEEDLNG